MLLGVGQGLLSPSVSGLLSRITPMNRAGGRFRHAHLGTDARPDDQLLGFECLARQGRPPRLTGELSASTWSPSPWRAIWPHAWSPIKAWPTPLMIFKPRNRSVSIKLRKGLCALAASSSRNHATPFSKVGPIQSASRTRNGDVLSGCSSLAALPNPRYSKRTALLPPKIAT